jgi:hypothetical protein
VLKRNINAFAWDFKDMKGIHPLFVLTIFISRRTENLLGNPKEGLLEPKFLGLFLRTYTNEVVHAHSLVLCTP